MPRRSQTRSAALATPIVASSTNNSKNVGVVALAPAINDDPFWPQVSSLRKQWKWAAFSQFFTVFDPMFNMPDVKISDIEDDLTRSTSLVLPKIIARLLYCLSYDRKVNADNFQSVLRKQYLKRAPHLNPLGPEPLKNLPGDEATDADEEDAVPRESTEDERRSSAAPEHTEPGSKDESQAEEAPRVDSDAKDGSTVESEKPKEETPETKGEESADLSKPEETKKEDEDEKAKVEETKQEAPVEESKDWTQLDMLEKLDCLHLLTEWQFQNPHRVRQIMKSDDETAVWRVEPIGYDSKSNAYWLIGTDRLWIQRVPPKPPRSKSHKRKRPTSSSPSKKRPALVDNDEFEDNEMLPSPEKKRRGTAANSGSGSIIIPARSSHTSTTTPTPNTNTRRSGRAGKEKEEAIAVDSKTGRGSRAAKTQANLKLDAQAKELAALQRLAALESKGRTVGGGSPRKTRGAALMAAAVDGTYEEEEEEPAPKASSSKGGKGTTGAGVAKGRAQKAKPIVAGTRTSARLRGAVSEEEKEWQSVPEEWLMEDVTVLDKEGVDAAEGEAENGEVEKAVKTGLEDDDDAISELTALSEDEEDGDVDAGKPEGEGEQGGGQLIVNGIGKAKGKTNGKAKGKAKAKSVKLVVTAKEKVEEPEPEPEPEPEWKPPEDWVEWETICVTLYEWEHIAERWENATHYTEKALYKLLTQSIVPSVLEGLRAIENQRKLEEAIASRKRSSRLQMKESEKEAEKLAAQKRAEEDEKLARERRAEARAKKEEEERLKREEAKNAREKRRRDREEREEQERLKKEQTEEQSSGVGTPVIDVVGDDDKSEPEPAQPPPRKRARPLHQPAKSAPKPTTKSSKTSPTSKATRPSRPNKLPAKTNLTASGSQTPAGDDWELDCEVCGRRGVNQDGALALLCCGRCSKWQHIACHDHVNRLAGRPPRNWDAEEFVCQRCRSQANGAGQASQPQAAITNGRSYPHAGPHTHHPATSSYVNSIGNTAPSSSSYLAPTGSRTVSPMPATTTAQWRPDPRSSQATMTTPYSHYATSVMGYPAQSMPYGGHAYGTTPHTATSMTNGGTYVNGYGTSQVYRPYLPGVVNGVNGTHIPPQWGGTSTSAINSTNPHLYATNKTGSHSPYNPPQPANGYGGSAGYTSPYGGPGVSNSLDGGSRGPSPSVRGPSPIVNGPQWRVASAEAFGNGANGSSHGGASGSNGLGINPGSAGLANAGSTHPQEYAHTPQP